MLVFVSLVTGVIDISRFLWVRTERPTPAIVSAPAHIQRPVHGVPELFDLIGRSGLWQIAPDAVIPPILIARFPPGLGRLPTGIRKKAFLHGLLPVALLIREELSRERGALGGILAKINLTDGLFDFSPETPWQAALNEAEQRFLADLVDKYQTNRIDELLHRVDIVPVSLILAQAALESAWGRSRFAVAGNNLFGMRTWKNPGLVPLARDEDKQHKVASFDSLLDSVRSYVLVLNRVPAYGAFRDLRATTSDPMRLAEGLGRFSERGDAYVSDLKEIIRQNDLQVFDGCRLGELGGQEGG